jgi:hypothetical protein
LGAKLMKWRQIQRINNLEKPFDKLIKERRKRVKLIKLEKKRRILQ